MASESSTDTLTRYDAKQQERFHAYQSGRRKGIVKKFAGIIVVVTVIGVGWLLFSQKSTGTPPGQSIPDLGRKHVPEGEIVEYNSNPPTSGPHDEQWEKAGIYDQPLKDEKLVHSLEHGYVIISYNCSVAPITNHQSLITRKAFAHETEEPHEEPATKSGEITTEERTEDQSTDSWKDDPDCQSLVSELERIAKKLRIWKLIVVPRPNMDFRIALTAWTKLDALDNPDENRISAFVKAYRDKGPEKTME